MKDSVRIKNLIKRFERLYKTEPQNIFSSPGRIELLGNHTDHNHGKVLVSSINLKILAAVSPRSDKWIVIRSKGYPIMKISLNSLKKRESEYGHSAALVRGVAYKFKKLGYKIGGATIVCDSTIYKGAGVSSSAAFEVLIAKILSFYYNNDSISPFELAQISQFAESEHFNKPCGLLDQSGIALGGINYIDFKSTKQPVIENLKIDNKKYQFILINTGDDHSHLTPCYSKIKEDMKTISAHYNKSVLRDVNKDNFEKDSDELISKYGLNAYLRAEHFFEENDRVQSAYEALKNNDFETFLKMLDSSGNSSYNKLKNCYVESEDEKLPSALKYIKEICPNCYSRVHGGGFAGTMLMVIKKTEVRNVLQTLKEKFGNENVMLVSLTQDGTTVIK